MHTPSNPLRSEQAVFAGAMECSTPAERAAFLDQACVGNPPLRERIESLLRASESPCGLLDEPPTAFAALASEPNPSSASVRPPVERIGAYRLLECLGQGGCGAVYMAEQEHPIRRRVALKLIKAGMDTRAVIARFEAERQALALMDHPNIARVYNGGETPEGRPYFVMELVRGVRITEFCRENGSTREQRLQLFTDVCLAIHHAHQKGIIHRDIKPANILVTVNDGVPVPKVIDFGIAKAISTPLTDKTLFTQFHSFLGTPAYTSPEQAGMSSVDIDTRSDIYSLGVLLFELLTGHTPFDGDELLRSGVDEMRRILRDVDPPRPSTVLNRERAASASSTAPGHPPSGVIPEDLDWIVLKCLEKDRARRYDSAASLAEDVRRHLEHDIVRARPPSLAYRGSRWIRKNRALAVSVGIVTLAVLTGLVTSTALYRRELQARKGETEQRARAEREAARSAETARFLSAMLAGIEPEQARGRDVTVLTEMLAAAAHRVDSELVNQPELESSLRLIIGRLYRVLGQYSRSEPHLDRALRLRRELSGPAHPETLQCLLALADLYSEQGRLAEAEAVARQGFRLSDGAALPDTSLANVFRGRLARACLRQRKFAEAERLMVEGVEIEQRRKGDAHLDTWRARGALAAIQIQQRKFGPAAEILQEIVPLLRHRLPEDHPGLLHEKANLAAALQGLGRLDEAEALWCETLEAERRVYGPTNQKTLVAMQNLGALLSMRGNHEGAETLLRDLVRLSTGALGPEHPAVLRAEEILGFALSRRGAYAEAEAIGRRILEVHQRTLGAEHPRTLRSRVNLADALVRQPERVELAAQMYRETLAVQGRVQGPVHGDSLLTAGNLLLALGQLNQWPEAEALCREVYEKCLAVHGSSDPATLEWRAHLDRLHNQSAKANGDPKR